MEYINPVGEWVNLVLGRPEIGLILQQDEGPQSWDHVLFIADQVSQGDGGQKVTFTASSGEQTVTKTYFFNPDSYEIGLDISIKGPGETSGYYLTWSDGIPRAEKNPKQYAEAGKYLKRIKPLLKKMGRASNWGELLDEFRATHRRKRRLMEVLDKL